MGIFGGGEYNDVLTDSYVANYISVTDSLAIEAKVGSSILEGREILMLYNKGPNTVWFGPLGLTVGSTGNGVPLFIHETIMVPVGQNISVFLLCNTGHSATVVVQELA